MAAALTLGMAPDPAATSSAGITSRKSVVADASSNGRALDTPVWELIPTTADSHPFGGDTWLNRGQGIGKGGYVEHEYLVSAEAHVYEAKPETAFVTEAVDESTYTTRAIVRKPKDMRRWSGNVVVEYLNVTDNIDLQILWSKLGKKMMAAGDVYVGFTGKGNVIEILREFDPSRYSRVDMPNPVPATDQTCGLLPGDPSYNPNTSKLFENGLLWDMWSQIGLTFKTESSPLGKKAARVMAFGESQSGVALQNYYRWFGGNRTLVNDSPVFDGYFDEAGLSRFDGALSQCQPPLSPDDPQRSLSTIPDRGVPYFAVHTQWDAWETVPAASSFYRNWDVTGSNHVDREMYDHIYPVAKDLLKARAVGADAFPWMQGLTPEMYSPAAWYCDEGTIPEIPFAAAQRAAYDWFKRWATEGKEPPVLPNLRRDEDGRIVVDSDGNALGGLRLPELTVPIATYTGGAWGDCSAFHTPFSKSRKAELYSSSYDYVSKISAAAQALVKDRLLGEEDAHRIVYRAAERPVAGDDPAPIDVVVTFDVNGGTPLANSEVRRTVRVGEKFGKLSTPARRGHTFLGWYTARSGGSRITSDTVESSTRPHAVYAQWRKNPILVVTRFDVNGGSALPVNERSKTVTVGGNYGALPIPDRTRHNFVGWFTAVKGGSRVSSSAKVRASRSHVLYARWSAQTKYAKLRASTSVTLRQKASRGARKTTVTIKPGQNVKVIGLVNRSGTSNDWLRVIASGKKGYVLAKRFQIFWR